jgi:hypothetical protein
MRETERERERDTQAKNVSELLNPNSFKNAMQIKILLKLKTTKTINK